MKERDNRVKFSSPIVNNKQSIISELNNLSKTVFEAEFINTFKNNLDGKSDKYVCAQVGNILLIL